MSDVNLQDLPGLQILLFGGGTIPKAKGQRKSTPLSLSGYQLLEAWITISLRLPFNNIVLQKNQFSMTQVCCLVWRCTPNFWPAARPLPAGGVTLHSHKHKRQHYYANNMLCQLGRGGGGSRQYQGMQFMYDCQILQLQSYVPTESLAKAKARKMV